MNTFILILKIKIFYKKFNGACPQNVARMHLVSVFLFQDDRLFSAQMCASCSVICARTQKALNRTGHRVLPDCCNHTASLLEPHQ